MASFTLKATERNLKIADYLSVEPHLKISREREHIRVEFGGMLSISRLEIDAVAGGIADKEWRELAKEIRQTLAGAKIREFTDIIIGIWPLRKEGVFVRLDSFEKRLIQEAAETEHRTISDFVRMAALEKADQALIKKSMIKKRVEATKKQTRETEIYG